MDNVFIIDVLSFVLLAGTVVVMLYRFMNKSLKGGSLRFIILSFLVLWLVVITNIGELLGLPDLDLYEDPLETLFIPLFIFSVFSFCLQYEIEDNKKKENLLRKNHSLLEIAMQAAHEGLWFWDRQKQQLVIEQEHCHLTFQPVSYVIHQGNYPHIIHETSWEIFVQLFNSLIKESSAEVHIELMMKTLKGDYKWVLFKGKVAQTNDSSSLMSSYGTLTDISTFKDIQHELIKTKEDVEKSEQLKTAFLYNMSHEIRTPLNGIVGFTELILDDNIPKEVQSEYFKLITASCHKLTTTVENIVEISKITVGDLDINEKKMDVNPTLHRLYELYLPEAHNKGIDLILTTEIIPECNIYSDETKIFRIFENLLNNAIKFTNQGTIEFGYHVFNDQIDFFVEDTGIGIPQKNQYEIFNNFRQLEVSFKRRYSGTGLGLSISKGLIEALGGQIKLQSEVDKGTRISFSLPYFVPKMIKKRKNTES